MKNYLVGYGRVDITPQESVPLAGYGATDKRMSTNILSELYATCIAFSCGDEKAIIFNCECIGMKASAYDIIKKQVSEACGISEDAIYINCIHSHTTFVICPPDMDELDDMDIHLLKLFQQFIDCAKLALADLKPCKILTAIGEAKNIAFVRKYRMKDGSAKTNPAYGDPDVVEPIGKPDDHVRIIRIQREGDKEILIVHFGNRSALTLGKKQMVSILFHMI